MRAKPSARGPWVVYQPGPRTYWRQGLWVPDVTEAQHMSKGYARAIEDQLRARGLLVYATKTPQGEGVA
jgi:hypothetical protein